MLNPEAMRTAPFVSTVGVTKSDGSSAARGIPAHGAGAKRSEGFIRGAFLVTAALLDVVLVVLTALAVGEIYHRIVHGSDGEGARLLQLGGTVALLFVTARTMAGAYRANRYLSSVGEAPRLIEVWTLAVLGALLIAFMTKTAGEFSRGTVALFFLCGATGLYGARAMLVHLVRRGIKTGHFPPRRVFLVGPERDVIAFQRTYQPWNVGFSVVGTAVVDAVPTVEETAETDSALARHLSAAAMTARQLAPDDVFILASWSQKAFIERCAEPFLSLPVSIHLGPERILDRFQDLKVERFGALSTLSLTRPPLSGAEQLQKRLFDIVLAGVGVVLLLPLFAAIAIAIRLDGPGPILFRQQRYGFNQRPFRIVKFRTMTTLEDGEAFRQVRRDDPRVTRVGAILRRYNLDELPQLANVLRGEMALVGPRPHALAHDRAFEDKIAYYARRHNVKPGITGWAQVNGLRGETDTEEKMEQRVNHDLFYIENWSMGFDVKILIATVFSSKAYMNAR